MSVVLPRQMISEVSRSKDIKGDIIKAVGDLSGVDVFYNQVLLGTYVRPERTAGGIIRPDFSKEEDVYQGKVGVVLKLGPDAFMDDGEVQFRGQSVNVGDWVAYKIGDAMQIQVGNWPCRLIRDSAIRLRIKDPNIIL